MIELTEDQIGNLLGVLLLACVIGLVAVYVRFGGNDDRRDEP